MLKKQIELNILLKGIVMSNELSLINRIDSAATAYGYMIIDCPNSSFTIESDHYGYPIYTFTIKTRHVSMITGNLNRLNHTKEVDALILIKQDKED